jgi:hypothetical protein
LLRRAGRKRLECWSFILVRVEAFYCPTGLGAPGEKVLNTTTTDQRRSSAQRYYSIYAAGARALRQTLAQLPTKWAERPMRAACAAAYTLIKFIARREGATIRAIVALDDDYRAYQDVLLVGIQILRPDAEVQAADVEKLEEALRRFEPHLVICDQPETVDWGGQAIWVELSVDLTQPTKVSACGHYTERMNPTLHELLGVVDEVKQLHWPNKEAP